MDTENLRKTEGKEKGAMEGRRKYIVGEEERKDEEKETVEKEEGKKIVFLLEQNVAFFISLSLSLFFVLRALVT